MCVLEVCDGKETHLFALLVRVGHIQRSRDVLSSCSLSAGREPGLAVTRDPVTDGIVFLS